MNFEKELERLINCHSLENESDTPDYILAEYIQDCLDAFRNAVKTRDKWWGFIPKIGASLEEKHGLLPTKETKDEPREDYHLPKPKLGRKDGT